MPASTTFSLSSACQPGGGVLSLNSLIGASGTATFSYDLTGDVTGPLSAGAFVPADLPLLFAGLANDTYTVTLTYDDGASSGTATKRATVACTASVVISNVRTTGATALSSTGSVLVDVTGATDPVDAAVFFQNPVGQPNGGLVANQLGVTAGLNLGFAGLLPNDYVLHLFTATTGGTSTTILASTTFTIAAYVAPPVPGCTDPDADNYDPNATVDNGSCTYTPPARLPYFAVPKGQSLRFVLPGQDLPGFDNQLLADQTPIDTTNPGYCQKVQRSDTLVVQFHTNYANTPTVQVRPAGGGTAVLSPVPVRIMQGAGSALTFDAYARRDANPARLRLYFNSDALPLPFAIGNRITLGGAGTMNGTYPVLDVREDAAAAVPYLLLPVAYPSAAQRIDLQLSTTYAVRAFDTWQVVLPFATVPAGCYEVRIGVTDTGFSADEALSEPIDVATVHADTLEIVYRNFDNAFNLNYTAGQINRLRVRARFFDRQTATQKEVLRESSGRLNLLSAEAQRRAQLDTYLLPGWLHETLALAFCHDFVRVDGLEVIAEESYDYPAVANYTLAKGGIVLEQVDFLGAGNRDDVGDVDGADTLLLANNTFLRVNP